MWRTAEISQASLSNEGCEKEVFTEDIELNGNVLWGGAYNGVPHVFIKEGSVREKTADGKGYKRFTSFWKNGGRTVINAIVIKGVQDGLCEYWRNILRHVLRG